MADFGPDFVSYAFLGEKKTTLKGTKEEVDPNDLPDADLPEVSELESPSDSEGIEPESASEEQMREILSCYAMQSYPSQGSWRIVSPIEVDEKGKPRSKYDIEQVIDFAGETESIYTFREGQCDGPPWIIIGKLKDGVYFHFDASCDYTGFDCQGGGIIHLESSLQRLYNFVNSADLTD